MRYFSDVTQKFYSNVDDCMKAEKQELLRREEAKVAQEKKDADRKTAAAKVDEARKVMVEAQKRYREELEKFCKTYKTYHFSVDSEADLPHLLDWFSFL